MKGGEYQTQLHRTPEEIMSEIKKEHSDPVGELSTTVYNALPEIPLLSKLPSHLSTESIVDSISDSKIVQSASTLAEGVATNVVEKAGDLIGIDVDNPQQVSEKLDNINKALTNPENVEKAKDVAANLANVGLLGLQAAEPFIDPLVDKVTETAQKGVEKASKAFVSTAANVSGLFLGPIIDIPRTVMSALEAGQSVMNTGSEIVTTASDTINAMTQNFKQIANENKDVLDRTQKSINEFVNPINQINPINPTSILKQAKYQYPNQYKYINKMGGTRKKQLHYQKNKHTKNYKNKSKKVRFYFD